MIAASMPGAPARIHMATFGPRSGQATNVLALAAAVPAESNRILWGLPPGELERLSTDLEPHSFRSHATLFETGDLIEHVYFPLSGIVSVLVTMENGDAVEIANVGNEGVVNFVAMFGAEVSPMKAVVQVPGEALRVRYERLRDHLQHLSGLNFAMQRYADATHAQVAQSAACNRLHRLDARTARWLLTTHDRVVGDDFPVTQEFLANMLGVRRPSVTVAMGAMQQAGLVDFRRGVVTVRDRSALEAAACECYAVIRHRMDEMLAG